MNRNYVSYIYNLRSIALVIVSIDFNDVKFLHKNIFIVSLNEKRWEKDKTNLDGEFTPC